MPQRSLQSGQPIATWRIHGIFLHIRFSAHFLFFLPHVHSYFQHSQTTWQCLLSLLLRLLFVSFRTAWQQLSMLPRRPQELIAIMPTTITHHPARLQPFLIPMITCPTIMDSFMIMVQDSGPLRSMDTPMSIWNMPVSMRRFSRHRIIPIKTYPCMLFPPGKFAERDMPDYTGRNWTERAFTVGIGG